MKTRPATPSSAGHKLTHQSKSPIVRFPGSFIASRELGVHRAHLHMVLRGQRQSHRLLARWNAWLKANPEFLRANRKSQKAAQAKADDANRPLPGAGYA